MFSMVFKLASPVFIYVYVFNGIQAGFAGFQLIPVKNSILGI